METEAVVDVIKVAADSPARALAGCIAGVVREQGRAEVQAVGAGAVNQACKAVAIAREFLVHDGVDIVMVPTFASVDIQGEEKTALRFAILRRRRA